METMDKEISTLKKPSKKVIYILIAVCIAAIILRSCAIPVWKNPVKSVIKKDATSVYSREELGLPDNFKSILIDPSNMIWLGWATEDEEDYYCLYGSTTFTHSSYSNDFGTVTMRVELVFTEEEWLHDRIAGYATFYSSKNSFYEPISSYRVYVSVYGEVIRSSGVGSMHYMGHTDSRFGSLSSIFMREMLVSFDNFLDKNDFKDFHNA